MKTTVQCLLLLFFLSILINSVHSDFCCVSTGDVNCRSGPGTEYSVIKSPLPNGPHVCTISITGTCVTGPAGNCATGVSNCTWFHELTYDCYYTACYNAGTCCTVGAFTAWTACNSGIQTRNKVITGTGVANYCPDTTESRTCTPPPPPTPAVVPPPPVPPSPQVVIPPAPGNTPSPDPNFQNASGLENSPDTANIGIIAAGVAIPLLVLCPIPFIIFYCRKRRRNRIQEMGRGLDIYLEKIGPGWQEISSEYSMKKLHPNSFDYQKFQDIDNILDGGLLVYENVWAVNNERLVNSFVNYRLILSSRHQDDPSIFAKTDWTKAEDPEKRQWTIDQYNKHVQKFSWNTDMSAAMSLLPVIAAVHGTSYDVAQKICRNGFAALSSLDQGYYGQGIYFTCHVPYIFPYIATVKKPTMLIVLLFPGNVFPVIEKPSDPNSLLGKPMKSGYQSHYVITCKKGFPVDNDAQARNEFYDELVIIQESQILPIYLVELDSTNFASLVKDWQREVPKSSDEERKLKRASLTSSVLGYLKSGEERF